MDKHMFLRSSKDCCEWGGVNREISRDVQLEFIVSVYLHFGVLKKKSPNLYAKKYDGLLVNNNIK